MTNPSKRSAFSLIELIVVIGIISVFFGLTIPAVQKVRSAVNRIRCANNLRQIALAAHQYHDLHGSLPAGLSYEKGKSHFLYMSWLTRILPFIDQDNLWRLTEDAYRTDPEFFHNPPHVGFGTVVHSFNCPADGRVGVAQLARNKFLVGLTSYLGVEGTDLRKRDGVLFVDSRVRLTDVTDGTSNTLLAGERPPSSDFWWGWWYAGTGQRETGSGDMLLGARELNVLSYLQGICPPGPYHYDAGRLNNECDRFHFWSLHSGGANFVLVDGSTRFLTYSADSILPALATRAGGEIFTASEF
jgi:prepilin-type N-terminal cleavage/methylation domain-containing protein/prepilin-type processing-associated H-X9-DG protein